MATNEKETNICGIKNSERSITSAERKQWSNVWTSVVVDIQCCSRSSCEISYTIDGSVSFRCVSKT